jgi:hypothetical protein
MVEIYHKDSVREAGVFLTRQLEQRLPKVYQRRYPALKFANGELLPLTFDLESGAESIVEEIMDTVGEMGEAMPDSIDDIPLADAAIAETKFGVIVKPIAIRYSVRELAAAAKGGRNIRGLREFAARRAIEEAMNKIGAVGDRARNLVGLLNDGNIPIDSTVSIDPYAVGTTADQLIKIFTDQVSKVIISTNMSEEPDTVLCPVKLHERITVERVGDTGTTVKKFILENSPWIKDIIPCNEMANSYLKANGVVATNSTKDMLFIYPRNSEIVHRMAEPLQVMQPQLRGLNYVVIMLQASTGAINHYPGSCLRVEIPGGGV